MLIWAAFSPQWALRHKVTFDGLNRRIYVSHTAFTLNVKEDIYSSWKEWMQLLDNAKFLPAIRAIGGDSIGSGKFAGDLYFLQNGWRIEVTHPLQIEGVLYSDDFPSPYVILPGGSVSAEVSAIVQRADFTGTINNIVEPSLIPEDFWNYLVSNANTPGSMGERFKSLLTVAKYLGLK